MMCLDIMWGLSSRLRQTKIRGFCQFVHKVTSRKMTRTTYGHTGQVRWNVNSVLAPLLTATPSRALIDEQIVVKACHLPRSSPVTLRAWMLCEGGNLWESISHYHSDDNGTHDLTRDFSVSGSYTGCEPMGLFWSLQPAIGKRNVLRLRKKNVHTPYTVNLSLLEGHIVPSDPSEDQDIKEQELATVTVQRWYMAPGVKTIDIRQNKVVGTLFLPPGPGLFPGVLDLWGAGGGLVEYRAALLASLALAYFKHKDIAGPFMHIRVSDSYFKAAWHILQDHPQVCGNRIAITALSYGVYLALRITMYSSVTPKCLVCINGPLGGFLLPSEDGPCQESSETEQIFWSVDDQGYVSFLERYLPSNLPPANIVPIEDLECPLLYIAGEDDLTCDSLEFADVIEKRLFATGKSHLYTRISYPGAGHLIEPPYSPSAHTSVFTKQPNKYKCLFFICQNIPNNGLQLFNQYCV